MSGDPGVTVAVDAMGGDHGAAEVVPGALAYAAGEPQDCVVLVGDPAVLGPIGGQLPANVRVVEATEVVGMDEHPARALVRKKDSTIVVATELVRSGEANAVVTAGHTGAGMAAGKLILGSLPGIERPALAVQIPAGGRPFVLLDIGANPDSTAENLAQYARMGAIFSERVLGVDRPRVALLSIGEEKGKGDARIARATELLDRTDLNFIGNVEGKDLTTQMADVVVCDAVVGNVVIKFFEGLSTYIADLWRTEFRSSLRGRLAGLLMRPGIGRIRDQFDYEKVGGSPLLGVDGTMIITHGRARRRMIEHAVRVAARSARERVPERIAEALAVAPIGQSDGGAETPVVVEQPA
jgi:glycerol-3-phosphate acyltransferase PlsX